MTISTTTTTNRYTGNGVTTVFPYAYRILAATDLVVTKLASGAAVETPLSYPGDYSVSGMGNATGGSITLSNAPLAGDLLVIRRVLPLTQGTSIRNQGSYFPETHENVFDKNTMVDQQAAEAISRTFALPATLDPASYNMTLPKPSSGQVLIWGTNNLTNGSVSSGSVVLPGSGRTTTTLTEYLANNYVYNILDYDADPAGLDNSTVIQNLLDIVGGLGGGVVYVPPGTFKVQSVVSLWSNTLLVGAGRGVSTLQHTGTSGQNVIQNKNFLGTPDHDIGVFDLTVDANHAGATSLHGIRFTNVNRGYIARNRIINALLANISFDKNGVASGINTNIHVWDNEIEDSADSGIDIVDFHSGSIVRNQLRGNAQTGINLEPTNSTAIIRNVRVSENFVTSPSAAGAGLGIHVQGYSFGTYEGAIEYVLITDNIVYQQPTNGIRAEGANLKGIRITDNIVTEAGQQGILVKTSATATKYVAVHDNTVWNCSTTSVGGFSGIELSACQLCAAVNNRVVDTNGTPKHRYGVEESSAATNNRVAGNVIAGFSLGDLGQLAGATHPATKALGQQITNGVIRSYPESDAANRYRGDWNQTSTGLHITSVDDVGTVNLPIFLDSHAVEAVAALATTATPSVVGANVYTVAASGTAVTDFVGVDGQTIKLKFSGARTITQGATIELNAAANFVGANKNMLVLTRIAGVWYEDSRKV